MSEQFQDILKLTFWICLQTVWYSLNLILLNRQFWYKFMVFSAINWKTWAEMYFTILNRKMSYKQQLNLQGRIYNWVLVTTNHPTEAEILLHKMIAFSQWLLALPDTKICKGTGVKKRELRSLLKETMMWVKLTMTRMFIWLV